MDETLLEKIRWLEEKINELTKKSGGGITKASSAEILAGVDDTKYPTPKGLKDAGITSWLVNQVFN